MFPVSSNTLLSVAVFEFIFVKRRTYGFNESHQNSVAAAHFYAQSIPQ